MSEPKPFTDEELVNMRKPHSGCVMNPGNCPNCFDCRYLATIAARDKRIDALKRKISRLETDPGVDKELFSVVCHERDERFNENLVLQTRLERMEKLIKEAKSGWSSADNVATGGHTFYRHEIYHDWLKRCQALAKGGE